MGPVSSAVIFSSSGSGEGMDIVGFTLEWCLPQTQGEAGKGAEGTREEVFIMRAIAPGVHKDRPLPTFII